MEQEPHAENSAFLNPSTSTAQVMPFSQWAVVSLDVFHTGTPEKNPLTHSQGGQSAENANEVLTSEVGTSQALSLQTNTG